jgi:hypothetical protein
MERPLTQEERIAIIEAETELFNKFSEKAEEILRTDEDEKKIHAIRESLKENNGK